MPVQSLGQEEPLEEEEMAIHSGILAWEIPRTEEPGGLQSVGLQRDTTEQLHNSKCIGTGETKRAEKWLSGELLRVGRIQLGEIRCYQSGKLGCR